MTCAAGSSKPLPMRPADYGFHPPSDPRPHKSLCDDLRTIPAAEARRLFAAGVRNGMISTACVEDLSRRLTTGRRFELARILGDQIASGLDEHMIPVTRSHTYRQKLQRAFAAELLCPFEALDAFLDGDYSAQGCEDAAQHFKVSEQAVWTLLINNDLPARLSVEESLDWLKAEVWTLPALDRRSDVEILGYNADGHCD
jgi:hypothetical protein